MDESAAVINPDGLLLTCSCGEEIQAGDSAWVWKHGEEHTATCPACEQLVGCVVSVTIMVTATPLNDATDEARPLQQTPQMRKAREALDVPR